ncbi:DUF1161 domain-containing protein [Pseudomonas gingeri NCPPB 3146 = LMG 5327]|uniref:DUF1161 domain-containing protein n=2 Tax=Pseudomonas gingeri TaxID=117681 RepID=A0A7Y7XXH5_9PSED|nr:MULTISPECIES: DUF1161 domain-containing protein [Pseudomonas]NWC14087.1 DUF1161 domain-containing protein [Pseudomonas gingeri]NWE47784.1 DUF1161 domain-containing protein [Pseudomonas gingeri]NWE71312.1 DUF1161 domain-containing protein [Pseudomonas gingeri]PNQ89453.1 DUF1161 domain-containing protein [Pseudomonas gingeri NCPPB 3146 = LMG 5327]BBP73935.1 hypothetical protein PHLH7_00390 [Pseudomonas sp. Ost2]
MKKLLLAVGLLSIAGTTLAAGKSCDELEREIKDKLEAKGVHGYSLQIVDRATGEAGANGRIVGTCEGGTKVVTYKRG